MSDQWPIKLLVDLQLDYGRLVEMGGNLQEKHKTVTNMRSTKKEERNCKTFVQSNKPREQKKNDP